ncbi:MAG: hypothetical protein IJB57_01475 [Clostridia bacterium]|nr:hypothetical protein [Clostridia bacterium]
MPNTDTGYLVVAVSAARGNFPIEGARVRVYSTENDDTRLLYTLTTDSSGRTEKIELPAPPLSASQTPDTGMIPYASYNIDTDYDGYYTIENINAPIYSGITSIQNVAMIPITDVRPNEDTRFNESQSPDL